MRGFLLRLILFGLVAGTATLFAVQNSSRSVVLGFDIGVMAWRLTQPVAVPALMGASLVLGLLVGLYVALRWRAALMHRVRALESELAMGVGTPDDGKPWR